MMQNQELQNKNHQKRQDSSYLGTDSINASAGSYIFLLSSFQYLLKKAVYWAFGKEYENHEDYLRKKETVNIIAIFTNITIWFLTITTVYNFFFLEKEYDGVHPLIFLCIALFTSFIFFLNQKDFINLSSIFLISIFFIGANYGAIVWGADMQMVILSYIITILIAFAIENNKKAVFISILSCLSISTIWYLEMKRIINIDRSWRLDVFNGDIYEFIIMFMIIISIAYLGKREIIKSLNRARLSEKALKIERDNLEETVIKRTEQITKMQTEKISELYRFSEFGRISAGIFHDISNPLTTLNLSIDKIKNTNRVYEINSDIEKISKASKRLGDMVGLIRKTVISTEENSRFNLKNEIKDVYELLKYRAHNKEIDVSINIDERLHIETNQLRFHQIILNILANAIDACEGNTEQSKIEVKTHVEKDNIVIEISDNGCGVPKEIQDKIFNPFFTTKDKSKGTGIGLSQTKHIVEKELGGLLSFTSINKKTVFKISLPIIKK